MGIQLITSLFIVGKLVSKTLLFNLWFCLFGYARVIEEGFFLSAWMLEGAEMKYF